MAEGENTQEPRRLSRRELLKKAVPWVTVTAITAFHYPILKALFGDAGSIIRCLMSPTSEFKNIQTEALKDSYDEALIVVHPGFGLSFSPKQIGEKEGYRNYLTKLKEKIEEARKDEKLVIFLIGADDMRKGKFAEGLKFSDADVAVVTNTGSPLPIACVETPEGKFLYQRTSSLYTILKEKGVKKIHIAGEFKEECVAQAENLLKAGFKVDILEEAVY